MDRLDLIVVDIRDETPWIRSIRLARRDGQPLPSWEAGAHVEVRLPDGGERSYSLINTTADPTATVGPRAYRLGVRREERSTGGSFFMHALKLGDLVSVSAPSNDFSLEASQRPVILVAGGIGVTPIVSMAAMLEAAGRPYRFIYAGRRREELAFLSEIEVLAGARLSVHVDDASGLFDVKGLMTQMVDDQPLYLCGPRPMIDAAVAVAQTLGWAKDRLRFEIFAAAAPVQGDAAFEIVLAKSGRTYLVPADRTILDVLIEAGEDPMHDCKRGECGICQVGVIDGVPDHRDYILSAAEKAAGKLMQICVSRSKSPRLTLDL